MELCIGGSLVWDQLNLYQKVKWLSGLSYFGCPRKLGSMAISKLGGGFNFFLFSPRTLGKISNLTNIFEMGWFNHELVNGLFHLKKTH